MTETIKKDSPILFVYGTLMSHADNDVAATLARHASKIGKATFRGKMFRVSRPDGTLVYPAVIPSDDESDIVHGEIYQLSSPSLFGLLDDYEACGPNDPEPHEYKRQIVEVKISHGTLIQAYIYIYALSTLHLEVISGGSFHA